MIKDSSNTFLCWT